jgi:hypothetical protein
MPTVTINCDAFNDFLRSQGYTEEEIAALGYQGAPTTTVTVKPEAGRTPRSVSRTKARRAAGGKKKSGATKKSSAKKSGAKKAAGKKKGARKR